MAVSRINEAGLNVNQYGNRNLIINGAMAVAQRATSATGIGTAVEYNTVDRWRFADAQNPPARFTQTQSTDAPDGFGFSHKFEVTTADTSVDADEMQYTDQFIEAQNLQVLKYGTSSAENFTLSFYVKCSVASTMGLRFTHEDGGGNYGASYTINATNTWERKSVTIPGNTATAINNDNGRGLRIAFGLTAGSDNAGTDSTAWGNGNFFGAHTNTFVGTSGATWQITGVQLEVGDTATDFEHRTYADELAKCMRYCLVLDPQAAFAQYGFVGWCESSTAVKTMRTFPVRMRSAPSFSRSGSFSYDGATSNPTFSSQVGASTSVDHCRLEDAVSNGNTGQGVILINQSDATATITFDAEL